MNRETSGFIRTAPLLSERLRLSWADGPRLRITGWTADELEWLRSGRELPGLGRLAVYPAALLVEGVEELPAAAGTFDVTAEDVAFSPAFPPVPGVSYSVCAGRSEGGPFTVLGEITATAAAEARVAEVTALYPTASRLPLNQLRFYVHFSHSMSEGEARRAIQLRDARTGAELRDAILPMPPELWDPEHRRLTLLLDPGRIKRGLALHEEAGYPLAEGSAVVFAVSDSFRDAFGSKMARAFARQFEVGPAIRTTLDPGRWQLSPPRAGTREPLRVEFDRSIDHALGERCLLVRETAGEAIDGRIRLLPGEGAMEFTPEAAWRPASYVLVVDPALEDVAGNSIARPFDRDLEERGTNTWNGAAPRLEFRCL